MNSWTTNHKTGTSKVSTNECIMIHIKDQTDGEMMFRIKKSTTRCPSRKRQATSLSLVLHSRTRAIKANIMCHLPRTPRWKPQQKPSTRQHQAHLYHGVKVARAIGSLWHPFHQLLSSQLQASLSKIGLSLSQSPWCLLSKKTIGVPAQA